MGALLCVFLIASRTACMACDVDGRHGSSCCLDFVLVLHLLLLSLSPSGLHLSACLSLSSLTTADSEILQLFSSF